MGLRRVLLGALCFSAQRGGGSAPPSAEVCTDAEACADTAAGGEVDSPALLQTRKAGSQEAPVFLAENGTTARPPVVYTIAQKASGMRGMRAVSKEQCDNVGKLIADTARLSRTALMWDYACTHERSVIPDISSGCLYMASNSFVAQLLAYVEHPDPAVFAGMFVHSFFPAVGSKCPSELPGKRLTSYGGTTVAGCKGGLMGEGGTCIGTELVNSTDSGLKIFAVSGNLGIPMEWVKVLLKGKPIGEGEPSDAKIEARAAQMDGARSARRKVGARETVTIKLSFTVCDWDSRAVSASSGQIDRQVKVLNEAYSGKDKCSAKLYKYPAYDTKLRFKRTGTIRRVIDKRCSSCYNYMDALVAKYTKRKNGEIRVLVCDDTSILGAASFPWYTNRGIFIQAGVLPGGKKAPYNRGDTLSHELGHYLGLSHTFQGGCSSPGDEVKDTNEEKTANYGQPKPRPHSCGSGDPVHNFMDYVDDAFMCSFTKGQSSRIRKFLNSYNRDLI